MKRSLCIMALALAMTAGCAAYGPSPGSGYPPGAGGPYAGSQQGYGQDYGQGHGQDMDQDYMYNYLAPYGNWVDLDNYGYVWIPRHMGYRWRPYSQGHWIMTDYGWTWMANEPWGSIPFHYGRWGYDDDFGWFWVPGTVWGPAWVSWRWGNQYAGWAPLPPGIEFRAGMNFAQLSFNIPTRFWIFLQASRFLDRDIYRYALPYERNMTIINYTSVHNNIYYRDNRIFNEGMGVDNVRRVVGRDIPRYKVQDARQPGQARIVGRDVQVYRPAFRANAQSRPKAVLNRDEARSELARAKVYEPPQQAPVRTQESVVLRRQAEERALLEKTQSQEVRDMARRRSAEQARVRGSSEKAKIQQDYQVKIAELQKQHQAEKRQMSERHKADTEQVKRTGKPVKQDKPDKSK
jgi:Family of unknown function (DUF6600)